MNTPKAHELSPSTVHATRSPELQSRINNALRACNEIFSTELGTPKRKRVRRTTKAIAMRPCPKIDAIKRYRIEHPESSLLEAAEATGFFSNSEPGSGVHAPQKPTDTL